MSAPSESDLRRIFERSPIGIYRSTATGRFLYVNAALVKMLGYDSAAELLAVDLPRDVYADPDARAPLVERYLTAGVVDGVDLTWRRRDGALIHVRLYGHAIRGNGDDEPAGFQVQVIDLTELRSQRAETQAALGKLRSVMAQMPIQIWTTDRDFRIVTLEGTQYPASELIGTRIVDLPNIQSTPGVGAHERALVGGSETFESEWDEKIWLTTVGPMRDSDGHIMGVIGSSIDITIMRRLERNLQQTQRIESLGVLAGGVAHDFNNLLVAILGNADLALHEGIPDRTVRQAVESIRTASLRASELTNQLLAYSGRGQFEVGAVDVAPLIEEMVMLLAPGRNGAARLDLAYEAPPVRADPAQVRQVVMNLVTNAFDALCGATGEIRVRTRAVDLDSEPHPLDVITAPPGPYLAIEVGDSGVGMDVSTRRKIFDPFFTTKSSGHGLGLAAVLGIVRGHRGGLRLYTEPGKGSTFEVLFPVAAEVTPVPKPQLPVARSGKTVMVVDDEEMVREVLCHMIEDLGYVSTGASGGADALELAERQDVRIDAAIVDLTMPRMNGRAVVDGLRARRPSLPVILTSGYDRDRVAAADAAGFLRKPFRFETLEELLRSVLGPP
jgi:two-component system, cell cycle sensor histidine kinase and response regulator CckA